MTRVRPPDARRPVVLLGAGADAQQIAADLRRAEEAGAPLRVVGFLDDDPDASGLAADDLAALRLPGPAIGVLGPIADAARFPDASFVLAVASHHNMRHRARIVDALGLPAERYHRFVHPDATVPGLARVGHGRRERIDQFIGRMNDAIGPFAPRRDRHLRLRKLSSFAVEQHGATRVTPLVECEDELRRRIHHLRRLSRYAASSVRTDMVSTKPAPRDRQSRAVCRSGTS